MLFDLFFGKSWTKAFVGIDCIWRYVFCHYTASAYDTSTSYMYSFKNYTVCSKPTFLVNYNICVILWTFFVYGLDRSSDNIKSMVASN